VPRHYDVGSLADHQIATRMNPTGFQAGEFLDQHVRFDDDPWADDILNMAREDPGWDMVKFINLFAGHYGMARIGTTLVTHHHIVVRGQKVNEFPFGFVPPLKADYASRWHRMFPSKSDPKSSRVYGPEPESVKA